MADNRSLDEFVGGDEPGEPEVAAAPTEPADPDDEPSEREDQPSGPAGDAAPGDPATDDPEPMAETFAWSATGGECATCGGPAEERWRDGDDLVCGDCKAW